jgi:hypothetical protein
MYWRQAIHETGSALSQRYLLSLLEITHFSQCSGENMHLVQGIVMWSLVLPQAFASANSHPKDP